MGIHISIDFVQLGDPFFLQINSSTTEVALAHCSKISWQGAQLLVKQLVPWSAM